MKWFFAILVLVHINSLLFGQKKTVDFSTPSTWPIISSTSVCNDGKFLAYTISSPAGGDTLVVQSLDRPWKMELPAGSGGQFSEDSRRFFFVMPGDSLGILDLEKDHLAFISGASSYTLPKGGDGRWLTYQSAKEEKALILLDLFTNKEKSYPNVQNFGFNVQGNIAYMQMFSNEGGVSSSTLIWLDLKAGKEILISRNCPASNFAFDTAGSILAFLATESIHGLAVTTLRYFRSGMDSAMTLVNPDAAGMEGMVIADRYLGVPVAISSSGDKIFFILERKIDTAVITGSGLDVKVSIEVYRDEILKFEREALRSVAVVYLNGNHEVKRLRYRAGQYLFLSQILDKNNQENLVDIVDTIASDSSDLLKLSDYHDIYVISVHDGLRRLAGRHISFKEMSYSPGGHYLIWYDLIRQNWHAYDIQYGITRNISSRINFPLSNEDDITSVPASPYAIVGWLQNDSAVIIQGRYDIWQVDPNGSKAPRNLTGGYGLRTHTELRYIDFNRDHPLPIHFGDTLMLSAFDLITKNNGFFRMIMDRSGHLEKLMMAPKLFYAPLVDAYRMAGAAAPFFPLRAKYSSRYIVTRMSETEYPNLYASENLKVFIPVTYYAPQKGFNWFTCELHHWRLPDDKPAEGILFKPENFDSTRKYPVIFYYYMKSANAIHEFIHPDLSDGPMAIPWFVSRDYLVFVPNIYYKMGHPGRSAFSSVMSAAGYLSKMPWVDARHFGIQGHSFGGFETNYIVSHTSKFAAAVSAAGMSDLISDYGRLYYQSYFERGQGAIGFSLSKRPDLYFENSAVLRIDKISTPLLILHNPLDYTVPIHQGQELFSGMERMGKKAWLLSYEGEEHVIGDEKNKYDYSLRLAQFFDYYLKGSLPPKWMTEKSTSLELDNTGKRP